MLRIFLNIDLIIVSQCLHTVVFYDSCGIEHKILVLAVQFTVFDNCLCLICNTELIGSGIICLKLPAPDFMGNICKAGCLIDGFQKIAFTVLAGVPPVFAGIIQKPV